MRGPVEPFEPSIDPKAREGRLAGWKTAVQAVLEAEERAVQGSSD
jgi:hypothetical protein